MTSCQYRGCKSMAKHGMRVRRFLHCWASTQGTDQNQTTVTTYISGWSMYKKAAVELSSKMSTQLWLQPSHLRNFLLIDLCARFSELANVVEVLRFLWDDSTFVSRKNSTNLSYQNFFFLKKGKLGWHYPFCSSQLDRPLRNLSESIEGAESWSRLTKDESFISPKNIAMKKTEWRRILS